MFARKHLLRWLTTPYRQPDPHPNSGACIYPRRPGWLIAHAAPPGRAVRARRPLGSEWIAAISAAAIVCTSAAAAQHLRHIRFACVPFLIPAFGLPHGCADLARQGRPPFVLVTRRPHLYGRQGPLAGQRVRGAPLAQPQGRSLSARLRDGRRGQEGNCRLPALLQRGISVCAQTSVVLAHHPL